MLKALQYIFSGTIPLTGRNTTTKDAIQKYKKIEEYYCLRDVAILYERYSMVFP
jgi:hypothetical protein